MGKKRDQLQSWNSLIFDPPKTDVDEHIYLINTLGDMLGQTAKLKMEKFIDTMSTIIQTHLITCKTWAKITKKAKELEHIIRRCDPPAPALPNLTKGTAVPGLYLHIAHSNDKEETDIPQPFKGAQPKQPKTRGRGKGKQAQQKSKTLQHRYMRTNTLMMILIFTITMRITEVNPEAIDLIQAKKLVDFSEVKIHVVEVNTVKIHTKANIRVLAIKAIITKAIMVYIITHIGIFNKVIIMANLEAETMVMAEVITVDVVMVGPIIEAITTISTIHIMVMMMSTRQINMAYHVHYAVAITTPLNIVLRENTILMTLWRK